MLKIGYLVPFMVIKNMPDYDSFLIAISGKGILAQLPKRYANRQYRVGESGWAAVFQIKGARITLSQKSPQYVRKILEYLTIDLIRQNRIKFKKVARVAGSSFYKVAIEPLEDGLSQVDIIKICKPYLGNVHEYIPERVTLVKYSRDIEEYVTNALSPAPQKAIQKIIYLRDMNTVRVYVEASYVGLFLGKRGANAATAAKLTSVNIEISGV